MTTPWIAGATGLVGPRAVGSTPDAVALVRRPRPARWWWTTAADSFAALPAPSHLFIALGTTMAQAGSQAAFQAVDFDAVLTVARRPGTGAPRIAAWFPRSAPMRAPGCSTPA